MGRSGNAPPANNNNDPERGEVYDSNSSDSPAATTAAASKPPRHYQVPQPADGQQHVQAEAHILYTQPIHEHSTANAAAAGTAQSDVRGGAVSLTAEANRAHFGMEAVSAQPSTSDSYLAEPLSTLPIHTSALKSAASMYAASSGVDNLFTLGNKHITGDAGLSNKVRHQVSQPSEQSAADNETQKEFESGLLSWYKSQLQRHARSIAPGGRALSRSNSKDSD
ncbi:hypothetical protein ABBQ38_002415 [Trebouxia sp. C0009 RCD-2024]